MVSNSSQTAPARQPQPEPLPAPKPAEKPFTIKLQGHIPF
jgi:hypothetical protein